MTVEKQDEFALLYVLPLAPLGTHNVAEQSIVAHLSGV